MAGKEGLPNLAHYCATRFGVIGLTQSLAREVAGRTLTGTVGTADQIAAAHLYLMENQFVTGTVLTVDGGSILAAS